jgi:prepilin-type N-terminal cleavage/methylation domain-containing protein
MFKLVRNKKGFTLIEVLVVVVIIGILAALAAPRILGRIDDARRSADQALAASLTTAIEQFYLDWETDPTNIGICPGPETFADLHRYLDAATIARLPEGAIGEIEGRIGTITPVTEDAGPNGAARIIRMHFNE